MYENIIAIPFRNRDKHLEYFIKNTAHLLQQYLPNSKVVVVEQNEGKLFNRGALLNVAFKEYENKTKYFFTHDVDMNPSLEIIQSIVFTDKKRSPKASNLTIKHSILFLFLFLFKIIEIKESIKYPYIKTISFAVIFK